MGWVGESSCEEAQWVLAPPGGTKRVSRRAGLPGVGLTAAHREASTRPGGKRCFLGMKHFGVAKLFQETLYRSAGVALCP